MSKLDDLQTLVRLLKEFEFPVSPILEYAIKEKIEQLSSNGESSVTMPTIEVKVKGTNGEKDLPVNPITRTKRKPSVLQVVRNDGTVIECERVADTFCQAIMEVGIERVYSLKIPMDNMHLVTIGGNPQYPTAQHDMSNGYFVNVHSNTITKKRQLERIFKALSISWTIEIVESD